MIIVDAAGYESCTDAQIHSCLPFSSSTRHNLSNLLKPKLKSRRVRDFCTTLPQFLCPFNFLSHSTPFKLSFLVTHWLLHVFSCNCFPFACYCVCVQFWETEECCSSGCGGQCTRKGASNKKTRFWDSVIMLRYTIKNSHPFPLKQKQAFSVCNRGVSELAQKSKPESTVCGEWRHISSNFSPGWSFC